LNLKNLSPWEILPFLLLIIFCAPIFIVLSSLFGDYSDNWSHLYNYVLGDYISSTVILIFGVSILVFFIGTITAWIVTNYDFYGKSFFEWSLILPLSIPPYILAYTFTGLFDPFGDANNLMRNIFNLSSDVSVFPNVRNIYGAILVFSFTLYPYVYLVSRSAFLNQSKSMKESARLLGLSEIGVFFKLGLPIIRPAVIGGLMLVIMETLSDFGAVDHFAIQTFTTGIFRTWYGMYDLQTAMQLASLLLLIVGLFFILERNSRNNAAFTANNASFVNDNEVKLSGVKSFGAFLACFIPLFVGFILPITELIFWSFVNESTFFNQKFLQTSFNTISLAIFAGLITAFLALIINFSIRLKPGVIIKKLSSLLSIGYAVPGLILAVGMVQLLIYIDSNFLDTTDIVLTGSLFGLLVAYIIKTYALANSSIESGYEGINSYIDESSKLLGATGWSMLRRVHVPLMKTSFLTAALLVMSEVVKELPATLILRPFNFETLAVSTYIYAAEERMIQAASPAIAIVLIGLIPIVFLSKMIRSSSQSKEK
jgi:iron(III) transport system permease protein|tara:strand:- start:208 stop:1827 length:1620 start_codon:yes stop_codon:yes gene_type:complete